MRSQSNGEINSQKRKRFVKQAGAIIDSAISKAVRSESFVPKPPSAKYLMRTYGMRTSDWKRLWRMQAGKCGSCREQMTGRIFVDHEHCLKYNKLTPIAKRSLVRGLCCYRCNRFLIGKHTVGTARQILAYLERPPGRIWLGPWFESGL